MRTPLALLLLTPLLIPLLAGCAAPAKFVVREQCGLVLCYHEDAATGAVRVDHVHRGEEVLSAMGPAAPETQRLVDESCAGHAPLVAEHAFHGGTVVPGVTLAGGAGVAVAADSTGR